MGTTDIRDTRDTKDIRDTTYTQWRRKIVEFRGAGARRRAALPCFRPANSELFIAMNSPDDSLLLSWVHSESLSIRFRQMINFYTSFNPRSYTCLLAY